MAWESRVYVERHDRGLEEAWAAVGIRFSGFGTDDVRGAWYRVRADRAEEARGVAEEQRSRGAGEQEETGLVRRVLAWLHVGRLTR